MQDFRVLDVKFSESSTVSHKLYVKPHCVKEKVPEKPSDKTLFVVGVPPYYNEECTKKVFSIFGPVSTVFLHKSPTSQVPKKEESKYFPKLQQIKGFKIAYVVFQKDNFWKQILKHNKPLLLPQNFLVTGIQHWNVEYNNRFPDEKEMKEDITTFMTKFDEETSKKIQMEKDLSEPQEGWITVTRRGRNPGFARKESVAKQLRKRSERQRRKKEHTNFYTFQIKESKMKSLVALRKKFEDDKRKIAALKEARRFKPF